MDAVAASAIRNRQINILSRPGRMDLDSIGQRRGRRGVFTREATESRRLA